mmetsp:Transcript_25432/g.55318  ORF Transcript_25432/g.55318 Transcript_25432/m.55318 type:complete len:201 (-) Transcript_25432:115-717(-)
MASGRLKLQLPCQRAAPLPFPDAYNVLGCRIVALRGHVEDLLADLKVHPRSCVLPTFLVLLLLLNHVLLFAWQRRLGPRPTGAGHDSLRIGAALQGRDIDAAETEGLRHPKVAFQRPWALREVACGRSSAREDGGHHIFGVRARDIQVLEDSLQQATAARGSACATLLCNLGLSALGAKLRCRNRLHHGRTGLRHRLSRW